MDRILFFDTTSSGHRSSYDLSLIKGISKEREVLFVTKASSQLQASLNNEGIKYKSILTKRKHHLIHDLELLFQMLWIAKRQKVKHIHLLYLDSILVLVMLIMPIIYLFGFRVTGTLHWYPNKTIKKILLYGLIKGKVLDKVVVHGDYTKGKVLKLLGPKTKSNRIFSVPYPNLHNSVDVRNKNITTVYEEINIQNLKRPFLLAFGGLRYDKGLDLLIESLKKVSNRNFTLLIIGKEEHFDQHFIEQQINGSFLENNTILKLGYVPDEYVSYYFGMTDAVVLPYRKIFTGQSGPLTEGVAKGKFIIGPNQGELGYTIDKFDLGYTFLVEDTDDLAKTLQKYIDEFGSGGRLINQNGINQYKSMVSENFFWHQYRSFFRVIE
ncbi:glycosyltransferase [Paenibacillus sp. S28]|uniref:glycosyltransferase n=1 Tax=Paenibacillus sp. S28 TaxID=2767463 RepID=UPI00190CA702|nr:glycosyltransferase [Paenibacillus sp. S28]MBJ9988940.1 glycosyltransferase family 4 protein [Paenibacillus sp. S28]